MQLETERKCFMSDEATLRNDENYTIFKYGKHIIRFLAPIHWNIIQR